MKTISLAGSASALALLAARPLPCGLVGIPLRADTDPKAVLEQLQKAFAELQGSLDDKIKAKADVLVDEKVQRVNDSVTELQGAIDEVNKKLAAAALRSGDKGPTPEQAAYADAFNAFFRRGDGEAGLNALAVKASMTTTSDPDGGFLVPFEMEQAIDRVLMNVSAMRQLAQVITISTGSYKKQVSLGGAATGWVGETQARTATGTPTLAELEFTPGEIYANPQASQQLLDDARVDLAAWLAGEVDISFAEQEGAAFWTGTGIKKPRGVMDYSIVANASYAWGSLGYIPTGAAADFTTSNSWQALVNLQQALKTGYRSNANFVANRATVGKVRNFVDGQGRPLWQPSSQLGQPQTLLGDPLVTDDNIADVGANAYAMAYGDFRRGYVIVDRIGIRVLRDPYSNKPFVQFYTTKRVGGGVQNFEAIKILKVAIS
jgi:HK97 family phage major capsid protein